MREIKLIDIAKIQKWYMDIFYQEDDDYPDYRVIGQKNRHIQRILNNITEDKQEQNTIYGIIVHQSWNMRDRTFKPICDDLRALGYTIIQGDNSKQSYYQKHKQERIEYQKKYAKNNKEKVLKWNKKYKERHKEEIKKQRAEYYKKNKDILLQKNKEYRERKRK